jgi:hypothetical protein
MLRAAPFLVPMGLKAWFADWIARDEELDWWQQTQHGDLGSRSCPRSTGASAR